MKTREDLEKMFFDELNLILRDIRNHDVDISIREKRVNKFIFKTIIPEILKSVQPEIYSIDDGFDGPLIDFTRKAKELYGLDL